MVTKTDKQAVIPLQRERDDPTTFIVPVYCTAVQITLFIPTAEDYKTGWKATIFHDINK